jgi:L-aminoadipate-semialdehyde dehydrogenase
LKSLGPSASVKLARATDEAVPLALIVPRYIDEELQPKAEVPLLRTSDSGVLSGGEVGGKDLFALDQSKGFFTA